MSFPHRTAQYVPEENRIYYFDNTTFAVSNDGSDVLYDVITETGEAVGYPDYIPLASTGLEDSEGNEIFEGGVFQEDDRGIIKVAYLDWVNYQIETVNFIESYCNFTQNQSITLIGHALTDPDLVPDSFDVEEYFYE